MTAPVLSPSAPSPGALLREWRQRRRLSQLALALRADVSQRHLSFLESGRTRPSREMVLHLAEQLELPLRERNRLLLAAGFAPAFAERALDDPALHAARAAVELVLRGHEPYPALVVDRHWTLVSANGALAPLVAGVAPALLQPPVNVLRLSLHADGLAPRVENLAEWRVHLLDRLRRQVDASGDAVLLELLTELSGYPRPELRRGAAPISTLAHGGVLVPLRLATDAGVLSLISTTTVFGTAVEVTLSELTLECFYPADAASAALLRNLVAPAG